MICGNRRYGVQTGTTWTIVSFFWVQTFVPNTTGKVKFWHQWYNNYTRRIAPSKNQERKSRREDNNDEPSMTAWTDDDPLTEQMVPNNLYDMKIVSRSPQEDASVMVHLSQDAKEDQNAPLTHHLVRVGLLTATTAATSTKMQQKMDTSNYEVTNNYN
jgi:hypothetical protein